MFNRIKSKISKTVAAVLTAALAVSSITPALTVEAASNITINLNKTYQSIQGFGGMNHPVWINDLTSSQINTAFGNSDNQLGMSILRIHVDENKSNWSKELATAKAAKNKGAIVFATPWNPPSYMTESIVKNGKTTKRLKTSYYSAYADYLNEFVTYMKNNGVELYAISIQNEPDWGYEWTWWEPDEIYQFTKYYAGKINCRVISAESFSYNKNYYNKILNDSQALNNVDIIGTHFYGTQAKDMAYPLLQQKAPNKPLWMTEVYVPNSNQDADVWPAALDVSTNIHNALTNGFQAYVWWYIRRSYSPLKENGQISKRGYCMAQYSKFVRPGYVRVDAPSSPQSNVYVSAYKGNNQAVVVVVNQNSYQINQNFTVSGSTVQSVTRYRTSSYENLAKSSISVSNGTFNVNLPANSVSTFVCPLGSSSNSGGSSSSGSSSSNNYATLSDGWYYIKNVNAQKYLQVQGNTGKSGQNVELGTGNGADGQKWYLTNKGNGVITLKSSLGYMLDVTGGKNENGTNIEIWAENSKTPQDFMLKSNGNNQYGIVTKVSSGDKGLDASNKGTADGTNVQQYSYWGGTNQLWTFEKVSTTSSSSNQGTIADGWYYIKNTNAQKYLQVKNNTGANGQNVEIGTGTGVKGQKWYVTNTGDGYITLKNGQGYMLDVQYGKNEDGTNIQTYQSNGADAQKFKIVDLGNSKYGILTKASSDKKSLDVYNFGTSDGTNVCQWTFYKNTNQSWTFEKCSN